MVQASLKTGAECKTAIVITHSPFQKQKKKKSEMRSRNSDTATDVMNPFQILRVPEDSKCDDTIRAAFCAAALSAHPDKRQQGAHDDSSDDWLRVKEAYEMIKTAEGRRKARGVLQRHRAITSSSVVGGFVKLSECDHVNAERDRFNGMGKDEKGDGGDDDSEGGRNRDQWNSKGAEHHDNKDFAEKSASGVASRAYTVDGGPQAKSRGELYQFQCRCGDVVLFDVLDPNEILELECATCSNIIEIDCSE